MSHSTGPWRAIKYTHTKGWTVVRNGHYSVASVRPLPGPSVTKANAKLIAAAPELLDALKGLMPANWVAPEIASMSEQPEPKEPLYGEWIRLSDVHLSSEVAQVGRRWIARPGIVVLSSVFDGRPEGAALQYHVSASCLRENEKGTWPAEAAQPSDEVMERVRREFGMERAEEDNSGAVVARHLWLPVEASG